MMQHYLSSPDSEQTSYSMLYREVSCDHYFETESRPFENQNYFVTLLKLKIAFHTNKTVLLKLLSFTNSKPVT